LNLSHAVALVLHELHGLRRRALSEGVGLIPAPGTRLESAVVASASGEPAFGGGRVPGLVAADVVAPTDALQDDPCTRRELEAALADAEALLLEVGFLYPHTAGARMAKLRALLQRARIRSPEVALLRGMVCQLRWASRRPCADGPRH
jgi:tRNA/rRNA methyltransferase